jgi:uncharacterized membrane protein YeaQ/YmgE (transglycosylase-associated protein family)
MGWIIALIVGGIAGWLASKVMGRDADMGIFLNIVVGIIGSFVGNFVGQFFGLSGTIQAFSLGGFLLSFAGAIIFLGIVNMIKRGTVR